MTCLHRRAEILRVQAVGGAQRARQRELVAVDVDHDDAFGARHHRALHHRQADPAQPEHRHVLARPHPRGVEHRADAGGDRAAEQAGLVQRCRRMDPGHRDLRQHRVFGEGAGAHVVQQRTPVQREAAAAVGHQPAVLAAADRLAQVGAVGTAILAHAALGHVQRDHVIARAHAGHADADLLDHAGAFLAQDHRERRLGIGAGQGDLVAVADAAGDHAHQHLRRPWAAADPPPRWPAAGSPPRRPRLASSFRLSPPPRRGARWRRWPHLIAPRPHPMASRPPRSA